MIFALGCETETMRIRSVYLVGISLLLCVCNARIACAQRGPQGFVSTGVALDIDTTPLRDTGTVPVGSVAIGVDQEVLGLRFVIDFPTLDNATKRDNAAFSFLADWHGAVAPTVRLGFLAGAMAQNSKGGLGPTFGPEVMIAFPNHRVAIVTAARISLFLSPEVHNFWIVRPDISIRWAF
jgi:hypothetical protein